MTAYQAAAASLASGEPLAVSGLYGSPGTLYLTAVPTSLYQNGYDAGFGDGVASAPQDLTTPVVTIVSLPTSESEAAVVNIYDESGLSFVQLTCQDRSDGPTYIIYETGSGFYHPFNGNSTLTGSGTSIDPYVFKIYRRGRWPTGVSINFKARAIDTGGNLKEQT